MGQMQAYSSPEAWLADCAPWQTPLLEAMRGQILAAAPFDERVKWGNLFFFRHGPCVLIRHEPERVVLGFMRGKRLRPLEPLLVASGKYELANIILRPGDGVPHSLPRLAAEAAALNDRLGDPTVLPAA